VRAIGDGRIIATDGNTVRWWDAHTGRSLGQTWLSDEPATATGFSDDGRWVVKATGDGMVRVIQIATGFEAARHTLPAPATGRISYREAHGLIALRAGAACLWRVKVN
jgi:hypothetical protein